MVPPYLYIKSLLYILLLSIELDVTLCTLNVETNVYRQFQYSRNILMALKMILLLQV